MLPLLLKLFPVGKIAKLIVYTVIFTAAIGSGVLLLSDVGAAQETPTPTEDGGGITVPVEVPDDSEDGEEEKNPWETVIKEFDNGLQVHAVEYNHDEGVAEIYLSVDSEKATEPVDFVITDGTRTETGDANRIFGDLNPDQRQIYRLQLFDASLEHLTIDSSRTLWMHFGEDSELRYDDPVEYPILLGPVAGLFILALMVGLHKFSHRYRNSAKNPIEG